MEQAVRAWATTHRCRTTLAFVSPRMSSVTGKRRSAAASVASSVPATAKGPHVAIAPSPLVYIVSVPYGQLRAPGASTGHLSPASVGARQGASSYNLSPGIQQNLGAKALLDVVYVETLGHHPH